MAGRTGRRSLPTAVKRARGEKRKERLNPGEAVVPVGAPVRPSWLTGEARAEWDRIVPELLEAKVLAKLDRRVVAEYCQLCAHQVELVKELGEATGSDRAKLLALHRNGANALRLLCVELGLSPAARAKVKTSEEKPEDPLAEWEKLKQAHTVAGGKKG